MSVIPVDFAPKAPSQADVAQVTRLAREAGAVLGRHAHLPVRVRVDGSRGSAFAQSDYRLGVSVGLYSSLDPPRPADEGIRAWVARRAAAPRVLGADVVADAEWLRDQSLAVEGCFGAEYANPSAPSVEAAAAWVRENCRRAPVERVTQGELLAWTRRYVSVRDPKDQARALRVLLSEAVKTYGRKYREKITAQVLVDLHEVPVADARVIAEAVKKISLRRT